MNIKELMAKKKNGGAAPAKVNKKPSKPEVEDEDDESQVEGGEGSDEEEEEAPAAKPAKKPLVKKPAKAAEPEEDEDGEEDGDGEASDEDEDGEEDGDGEASDEDEEEAPAPKKGAKAAAPAKKAAPAAPAKKAPAKKAAAEDDEEVPTPAAKKGGTKSAWGAKPEKERKALTPGSWMPQEEMMTRFHEKLLELGIAPPTKSITTQVVKAFESFLKDTLSEYDVKFIEKFRRREMEARVYAPNTELAQVATPYHTLVSPHRKVSLNLYFDKTMTKGTVNDDGEFIEGKFNAKGNFTAGKWGTDDEGNETFTPAAKKAKK